MTARARPMKGHLMSEGGVIVARADNARRARTTALRSLMERAAESEGYRVNLAPEEWVEYALHYARALRDRVPEIGLWRWTPCSPRSCFDGGGHSGHLCSQTRTGQGVWSGVYWTDI